MALPPREDGRAHDRHQDAAPAARSGAEYLRRTLFQPLFPDLWAIRGRAVSARALAATSPAPPNALAPHYSRFRVAERLLLTGHSHQAWPDVALDGSARGVSTTPPRWSTTSGSAPSRRAERVRDGFARAARRRRRRDRARARAPTSWWCASSRRCRLARAAAARHDRRRVPHPAPPARAARRGGDRGRARAGRAGRDTLAERLAAARRRPHRRGARLVGALRDGAHRAGPRRARRGLRRAAASPLLVDAYHALGAVPFSLAEQGLERRFVVGGGYKYLPARRGQLLSARCRRELDAAAGRHRLVRRVRGARGDRRAGRASPYPAGGAAALRRRHLRPDEPLPRGAGLRLLRRAGARRPSSCARSRGTRSARLAERFDALDLPERARSPRPRDAARADRRLPRSALARAPASCSARSRRAASPPTTAARSCASARRPT